MEEDVGNKKKVYCILVMMRSPSEVLRSYIAVGRVKRVYSNWNCRGIPLYSAY